MAQKDLKNTPHVVNENWWWYEENGGLIVCHYPSTTDLGTCRVEIPWRSIRAALKRKDRDSQP